MQVAPVPRCQQKSCYTTLGLPPCLLHPYPSPRYPLPSPNPHTQDRGQTPVEMPMPAPAGSYPCFRTQHLTSLPSLQTSFCSGQPALSLPCSGPSLQGWLPCSPEDLLLLPLQESPTQRLDRPGSLPLGPAPSTSSLSGPQPCMW